jgi:hypothetical protein
MKKGLIPGLTFAAAFALATAPTFAQEDRHFRQDILDQNDDAAVAERDPGVVPFEESPSHIFLTREEAERALFREPLARRSPNMTYHGGKIMPTVVSKAIFWGTSWGTYTGDKITGLDAWYTGFSTSNYAKTTTEYTGSNGTVGAATTYQGHVIDASAASGGGNTSTILAEVCRMVPSPDTAGNGYYPVYTDLPRGNAGYCAWHSAGTCGGKVVQFAFFWKLDGDAGCDPQDTSGLHSQGLAALANVSGHELAEAMTDPASPGAWYDSTGYENGDKCAWTWGAPLVNFTNGTQWKVQGEWSNKAYTAGTGYPNRSGQRGCLSGQ